MDNTQIQPQADSSTAQTSKVGKGRKKRVILAGVVAIVLAVIIGGIAIIYFVRQAGSVSLLKQSLDNTVALQQGTYQVKYNNTAQGSSTTAKLDGHYVKGKGYVGTATTTVTSSGYGVTIDRDVVIDSQGAVYGQYKKITSTLNGKAYDDPDAKSLLQTYGKKWLKTDATAARMAYMCPVIVLQAMQSRVAIGQSLTGLLKQSSNVAIHTVSSNGKTGVYELTAANDKQNALLQEYQATEFYKNLTACSDSFTLATSAALKQVTVQVTIDKAAQRITNLVYTSKQDDDSTTIELALSPAQNVQIAIPKDNVVPSAS